MTLNGLTELDMPESTGEEPKKVTEEDAHFMPKIAKAVRKNKTPEKFKKTEKHKRSDSQ